jgi:hypothetical protein
MKMINRKRETTSSFLMYRKRILVFIAQKWYNVSINFLKKGGIKWKERFVLNVGNGSH